MVRFSLTKKSGAEYGWKKEKSSTPTKAEPVFVSHFGNGERVVKVKKTRHAVNGGQIARFSKISSFSGMSFQPRVRVRAFSVFSSFISPQPIPCLKRHPQRERGQRFSTHGFPFLTNLTHKMPFPRRISIIFAKKLQERTDCAGCSGYHCIVRLM